MQIGKRFYDDYVVIVPHQTGRRVIIQKQYKRGVKKYCYGFPAGFVKPPEGILKCAKRELLEETGYTAGYWEKAGQFYDNVSVSPAKFTIFFAHKLKQATKANNPDISETAIKNISIETTKLSEYKMEGACMALAKQLFLGRTNRKRTF